MADDDPVLSRRALLIAGGTAAAIAPAAVAAPAPAPADSATDRFAVTDTLLRYFRALDRADADLLRTCFTADAALDYPGAYEGGVDGFVTYVRRDVFALYQATMHFAGNMLIEIEGDHAFTETYAMAHHMPAGGGGKDKPFLVMWIRYIDRLTRADGWRIDRRHVVVEWMRSDSAGMWDAYPSTARRDRSDPSYRR